MVFSDRHMDELAEKMPSNVEELRSVSGFGDMKCSKYGEEIVDIINRHR